MSVRTVPSWWSGRWHSCVSAPAAQRWPDHLGLRGEAQSLPGSQGPPHSSPPLLPHSLPLPQGTDKRKGGNERVQCTSLLELDHWHWKELQMKYRSLKPDTFFTCTGKVWGHYTELMYFIDLKVIITVWWWAFAFILWWRIRVCVTCAS